MGFYRDYEGKADSRRQRQGGWRWFAVVAASAIVASGTTFVMIPVMQAHGVAPAASAASQSASGNISGVGGQILAGTHGGNGSNMGGNVDIVGTGIHTDEGDATSLKPISGSMNASINGGITQVVKKVEPAVMGVVNYSVVSDYFSQSRQLQPTGVGTGVLFHKDSTYGYAATNNHVVEGAAKVEVVLASGKHVRADVVGTDPYTDLAVLRVPLQSIQSITPATFANSDAIEPGEPAIAIGTPMGLDFADSVTAGIVSAKSRIMPVEDPQSQQTLDYQAVIQTDAAINPGNSGGPLLNIRGQIIGINSSKIVAQNFEGMGFAIPSNEVKNIADQIMKTGHATHPALGITGESLTSVPQQFWPNVPVDYGVWLKTVVNATAQTEGLKPNDVIVAIDGKSVKNMADLRTYLFQKKPGDTVNLQVYRGSEKLTLKITLGAMKSMNTTDVNPPGQTQTSNPYDPLNPFGTGQFNN